MYHASYLVAFGPGLIMALASAAMFILSNTLAQTRHARLWALSFAIYTVEWAAVALYHAKPSRAILVLVSLTMVAALFSYFAGFQERAGKLRIQRLAVVAALVFLGQALLMAVPGGDMIYAAGEAYFATARMILFAFAASLVTPPDRQASATERSVGLMLGLISLMNLGLVAVAIATPIGARSSGTFLHVASLLGTPTSAAMGLFTLMLIASDFSRDRLRLIHTDPLTGVLNRLGFEQTVRRPIARAWRRRRPVSLILADIDRFKAINDRYGHLVGDAALISFARCLIDAMPRFAVIGRFGGEEFALLIDGHSAASAASCADAIRASLASIVIPGADGTAITASFGVAELLTGETLTGLYSRADAMLYLSKQEGRDRVSVDDAHAE